MYAIANVPEITSDASARVFFSADKSLLYRLLFTKANSLLTVSKEVIEYSKIIGLHNSVEEVHMIC